MMMMIDCEVPRYVDSDLQLSLFPSELSAAGVKRGVRSLTMRTVPSRQSTQAQPAEGRPGPSDDNDVDADEEEQEEEKEDKLCLIHVIKQVVAMAQMMTEI